MGNTEGHQGVLLLNVTYEALEQIPYERAITLIVLGEAESVVDVEPQVLIRSQELSIPLPRTIILKRYVLVKHDVIIHEGSRATFPAVLRRDGHRCGYCGEYADTIDHILPQSHGGRNTWGNLIAACFSCNNFKADRTPEQANMKLLWPPKVPVHDEKRQRQVWKSLEPVSA